MESKVRRDPRQVIHGAHGSRSGGFETFVIAVLRYSMSLPASQSPANPTSSSTLSTCSLIDRSRSLKQSFGPHRINYNSLYPPTITEPEPQCNRTQQSRATPSQPLGALSYVLRCLE